MVFQWFFYMWTIGVDGFSMVFFMWTIDVNGFSMVFYMWTIGVNGFSMVLGKVKAGSQKKTKKTWFVQQIPRGKQSLDRLTWPNVTKKLQKEHPQHQIENKILFVGQSFLLYIHLHTQIDMFTSDYAESSLSCTLAGLWMTEKGWIKRFYTHHCHWMNGWKVTIDINGFTMVFGLQNHW